MIYLTVHRVMQPVGHGNTALPAEVEIRISYRCVDGTAVGEERVFPVVEEVPEGDAYARKAGEHGGKPLKIIFLDVCIRQEIV